MKLADKSHKALVVDILSQAFDDNKSVNYIIKQDTKRKDRLKELMIYSFNTCLEFGKVYLSDDEKGCALIFYPRSKTSSIKSIINDIRLAFFAIGMAGVNKAMKREALIKAKYPKEPFTYLWFIGVKKSEHKKGIGTKLMQDIIAESEANKLDILLETSTLVNIPWYESLGFKTYDTIFFDYKLFMLKRTL